MDTTDAFISYIFNKLSYQSATSAELKNELNRVLTKIGDSEEIIKLFRRTIDIKKNRNLDAFFLGSVYDFFDYAEYCLNIELNGRRKNHNDWTWLHYNLIENRYILNVSASDFNEVMIHKRLPNGKEQIKWIGKTKTEALYFSKQFGFTLKQFNECFIYFNGTNFKANNKTPTFQKKEFEDLLTKGKYQ